MVGDLQRVVGRNVKLLRVKIGMSQEQFAQHLGVHRTYMGAVERGERNLTLQTLEKLADQLRVDPYDLLSADSGPRPETAPARTAARAG